MNLIKHLVKIIRTKFCNHDFKVVGYWNVNNKKFTCMNCSKCGNELVITGDEQK